MHSRWGTSRWGMHSRWGTSAFPMRHIPIPGDDVHSRWATSPFLGEAHPHSRWVTSRFPRMQILTGNKDVPHSEWGCDSPGMETWQTGNADPHREWECSLPGTRTWFTGNPHPYRECITSPGMHIVYAGWKFRYLQLKFLKSGARAFQNLSNHIDLWQIRATCSFKEIKMATEQL